MKTFYLTIIIILFFTFDLFAIEGELIIKNNLNNLIKVDVYPVGTVFNGAKEYSLKCVNEWIHSGDTIYTKIIGGSKELHYLNLFKLDHDGDLLYCCEGESSIGYGKYRIDFYEEINSIFEFKTYCYVDYSDSDYPFDSPFTADIWIYNYSENDIRVWTTEHSLPKDKIVKIWDQRVININAYKSQNKNGFKSDISYSKWPINAVDSGATNHLLPNECYVNLEIKDNNINLTSNNNFKFISSSLIIKDSINFSLSSNSSLIFESGSHFRTFETGSPKTITMGENSLIEGKVGANINLNNTVFQTTNSSVSWKGIKLTDTYLDTINNCTFKNTDTAINLYNSDKCFARNKKIIKDSKFENCIVKLSNVFNALISNDSFYTNNNSQYLLTVSNSVHPNDYAVFCSEEENPAPAFNLNIAGNYFSCGAVQMYLNCLASEKTPFFIIGNVFQGTGSTTGIGLVSNKISGDFRYNSFLNDDYITSVNLLQSDLNFYENTSMMSGANSTLIVNSTSSARLAPVYSSGNYYWFGGYNKLFSNDLNNVYIVGTSSAFLDKGGNCFTIYNSNYYHVKSALTGSCNTYGISASENYWSAIPPLNHLICNSDTVYLFYQPYNTYCLSSKPEPFDYDIIDRGDGIYDTIAITEGGDFINGDGEDESMFGQALMSKRNKNYNEAIEKLKTVINNYDTSEYLTSSIDELYTNYQNKDTSFLQINTDILFSELKQYLESKITQHANNFTIVDKAYSYYLMCLTKMDDYDEAIARYENIMSNHPEPERRLLASWDRSALSLLQNGSGQGDNYNYSESLNEKNLKDKPVHSIAKTNFKNSGQYSDLNSDQNLGSKFSNDSYRKVLETKIIKFNPSDQTELDKKITEDLNFLLGLKSSEITETQYIKADKFQLNQNYPNPFNPSTKIAYSIPVSGNISIKIYDLTGKEVKTLLNEFKSEGSYDIEFNGSDLASGVYFYKLDAVGKDGNNFLITKRMMLIK